MTSNGKQLEALVAYVESTLLPEGFSVTKNERIINDEGIQIAEFDIEIQGKVGSTDFAWLIECRDRPTSGPAPGSWIEQLVGRRTRFDFNKVTAVSTTGFSQGAIDFANEQGIELREVKTLAPEEFADWLRIRHIHHIVRHTMLIHATFLIDEAENEERERALSNFLSNIKEDAAFLKLSQTSKAITPAHAFSNAAGRIDGVFDDLVKNGPEKRISLRVNGTDDNHYAIETTEGPIRLRAIDFDGSVCLKETLLPLIESAEYLHVDTGKAISQVASFAPQSIYGMNLSIEMHKMKDTGETHVVLRRLPDNS